MWEEIVDFVFFGCLKPVADFYLRFFVCVCHCQPLINVVCLDQCFRSMRYPKKKLNARCVQSFESKPYSCVCVWGGVIESSGGDYQRDCALMS